MKRHAFFQATDWGAVLNKRHAPPIRPCQPRAYDSRGDSSASAGDFSSSSSSSSHSHGSGCSCSGSGAGVGVSASLSLRRLGACVGGDLRVFGGEDSDGR